MRSVLVARSRVAILLIWQKSAAPPLAAGLDFGRERDNEVARKLGVHVVYNTSLLTEITTIETVQSPQRTWHRGFS